jgi:hypothetical protein
MVQSPEEEIEEISTSIESFRELKTIIYHQDYVYKKEIIVALNRLPPDIKENTVATFNHFYKTYKNVVGYLWKTSIKQKQILAKLCEDKDIAKQMEEIEVTLSEEGVEEE